MNSKSLGNFACCNFRTSRGRVAIFLCLQVGRSFVGVNGLISGWSEPAIGCFVVWVRWFGLRLHEDHMLLFWPLLC
uniref:Uncharacterized protein n=1 Tax=Salix viminalis TaxID=40686 RepID=A0A6N2M8E0_SALVM